MNKADAVSSILISAHALARIAAIVRGDDGPPAQWRCLSILDRHGAQRIGDLARLARSTQPGTTRLVGALSQSGLVVRSSDPADSRVTIVAISDAGRAALSSWRDQLSADLAPLFSDLDDDDWAALTRTADILAARTTSSAGTGVTP